MPKTSLTSLGSQLGRIFDKLNSKITDETSSNNSNRSIRIF